MRLGINFADGGYHLKRFGAREMVDILTYSHPQGIALCGTGRKSQSRLCLEGARVCAEWMSSVINGTERKRPVFALTVASSK